ncbi:MAG: DsbA family protein [Vicinamibacterales bacterium]
MTKARSALEITTTFAILIVTILIGWVVVTGKRIPPPPEATRVAGVRPPPPPARLPDRPVPIDGASTKGTPGAPIAIIAYSEFQCPFCARFATGTMPDLERAYLDTGKALLVFKHLPLESLHPHALKAAESAECAGEQGRFWPMHDVLFANQRTLQEENLQRWAAGLGLESARFTECLTGRMRERIKRNTQEAREFGITGTPTFLIGRVAQGRVVNVTDRISGARPFADFEVVIGRLLTQAAN